MAEILVKTLTRHRSASDLMYLRDWTAGDVLEIRPDGGFTGSPSGGAKTMGVVLLVDGDIPKDFAGTAKREILGTDPQGRQILGDVISRTDKIIDLRKTLTLQQLRDAYDHGIHVNPIRINKSYLDLFIPREQRTSIDVLDRQGSFSSGTIDVGPAGHTDANTFYEFESNTANLTGNLTGNCDEDCSETTAIIVTGFTTGSYMYKWSASGSGRHAGVWSSSKQRIVITSSSSNVIASPSIRNFWLDGLQLESIDTSTIVFHDVLDVSVGITDAGVEDFRVSNCIIRHTSTGTQCMGVYHGTASNASANSMLRMWNCVFYGFNGNQGIAYFQEPDLSVHIWNCTGYGSGYGIGAGGAAVVVRNTAVGNITNAGYDLYTSSGSMDMDYIVTDDDNSGSCANYFDYPTAGAGNWSSDYTDAANGDFSLKSTADHLRSRGTDDPGGAYQDNTDIRLLSRTSPWDIGAFEYDDSVAGTLPVFDYYFNHMRA